MYLTVITLKCYVQPRGVSWLFPSKQHQDRRENDEKSIACPIEEAIYCNSFNNLKICFKVLYILARWSVCEAECCKENKQNILHYIKQARALSPFSLFSLCKKGKGNVGSITLKQWKSRGGEPRLKNICKKIIIIITKTENNNKIKVHSYFKLALKF